MSAVTDDDKCPTGQQAVDRVNQLSGPYHHGLVVTPSFPCVALGARHGIQRVVTPLPAEAGSVSGSSPTPGCPRGDDRRLPDGGAA
jgi:hypothetical protein